MLFEPIQSPRICQQVAARIAEMIASGELKSGARLPNELELLRRFAVSRGAIREAMIALEPMLGRMKARVSDTGSKRDGRTFMERIAAASGNSMLQSMIEELWRLRDGRMLTTLRMLCPEQRAAAIVHREAIIAALRARDPAAARQADRGLPHPHQAYLFRRSRRAGGRRRLSRRLHATVI